MISYLFIHKCWLKTEIKRTCLSKNKEQQHHYTSKKPRLIVTCFV